MVDTSASPSCAGGHVVHERAVDLQRVHRQLGEVAERGEPGTEVIDGDAHAHGADRLQARDTVLDVLHDHAFGDLQFQSRRGMRVDLDRLIISATKSRLRNCSGDTFTAMRTADRAGIAPAQVVF